jgi:hypothetical protein
MSLMKVQFSQGNFSLASGMLMLPNFFGLVVMLPLSLKEVILKKVKEREKEKQLCFSENMSSSTSSYKTILPNIVMPLE